MHRTGEVQRRKAYLIINHIRKLVKSPCNHDFFKKFLTEAYYDVQYMNYLSCIECHLFCAQIEKPSVRVQKVGDYAPTDKKFSILYGGGNQRTPRLNAPFSQKREEQMEKLSWGTKIIGISICVAVFILLISGDKLRKILPRSLKPNKTK